jgi:hypothetical protein
MQPTLMADSVKWGTLSRPKRRKMKCEMQCKKHGQRSTPSISYTERSMSKDRPPTNVWKTSRRTLPKMPKRSKIWRENTHPMRSNTTLLVRISRRQFSSLNNCKGTWTSTGKTSNSKKISSGENESWLTWLESTTITRSIWNASSKMLNPLSIKQPSTWTTTCKWMLTVKNSSLNQE